MARAFRIAKAEYAKDTQQMLFGEGAKEFGGRWNTPGRPVIYTSASIALALLEVIANIGRPASIPLHKIIDMDVPDNLIQQADPVILPHGWDALGLSPLTQSIGNSWLDEGSSAVLQVPSVIIPDESNYLINPAHPDFRRIGIGEMRDFLFDPRLKPGG